MSSLVTQMLLMNYKAAMESSATWRADWCSRNRKGTAKSTPQGDSASGQNIRNIHMRYGGLFPEKRSRERFDLGGSK